MISQRGAGALSLRAKRSCARRFAPMLSACRGGCCRSPVSRLFSRLGFRRAVALRRERWLVLCVAPAAKRRSGSVVVALFAILRRPARAGDAPTSLVAEFSRPFNRLSGREVYVRYMRYARTVDGVAYYLVPVAFRCGVLARHGDGLSLESARGGGGGENAAQIESSGMWESESGGTGADPGRTTFQGVLPDGVTSVTLHYPAGKLGGFSIEAARPSPSRRQL